MRWQMCLAELAWNASATTTSFVTTVRLITFPPPESLSTVTVSLLGTLRTMMMANTVKILAVPLSAALASAAQLPPAV